MSYLDYASIQDFCDEIEGNDVLLERKVADKSTLVMLNSVGIDYDSNYGKILRKRVYSYVPVDLVDFYKTLKNKPLLTEVDYHIIEKLKRNEVVDCKGFKLFDYSYYVNSFKLFIKYDMKYENMRQFTDDVNWLLKSKDCTFQIARTLTTSLSLLSSFKEFKAYLRDHAKEYLDYKKRQETLRYVERNYLDFKGFIIDSSKYFTDFICLHYEDFSDYIVDNYTYTKEFRQCMLNNFYKCQKFEVLLTEQAIPIQYLLYREFFQDAKYLNYVLNLLEKLDSKVPQKRGGSDNGSNNESDNESDNDSESDSESNDCSDENGNSYWKSRYGSKKRSKGITRPKVERVSLEDSGENENKVTQSDYKRFLTFLLEDNNINVKKNNFSENFKEAFDKFFCDHFSQLEEFNKELTLKKIICMKYEHLYHVVDNKADIGDGETMAMYYIKIFQEQPPFVLRHDPTISHKKIWIGKYEKPYTLNEAWKNYIGDISIPQWMKSQKTYKEMCTKRKAEEEEIKTIGDSEFIVLYQTHSDQLNDLPYYKLSQCVDIGKKIKSQYCKSARVFLAAMCSKSDYDQIVETLNNDYKYNKKKNIFTGDIAEMCQSIYQFL